LRIHAYASAPHYGEHIDAIWTRLPESLRGQRQIAAGNWNERGVDLDDLVMVAAFNDIDRVPNRRLVYVEHGAGQRYVDAPKRIARGYHGGAHPQRVVGYLGPRQAVIDAWDRPGFACGAPICDPHALFGEPNVIAFAWHWDAASVAPEARTAYPHYADRLPEIIAALRSNGWEVLGTLHPKFKTRSLWRNLGVTEVSAYEVRQRACLLIADNTSLIYEMMYLGRSVITLNAPWYRRDVEHGLRFWRHAPATQIDEPEQLLERVSSPSLGLRRTWDLAAAKSAYGQPLNDGDDGLRAAAWLASRIAS
jgi:hypothetical protein